MHSELSDKQEKDLSDYSQHTAAHGDPDLSPKEMTLPKDFVAKKESVPIKSQSISIKKEVEPKFAHK